MGLVVREGVRALCPNDVVLVDEPFDPKVEDCSNEGAVRVARPPKFSGTAELYETVYIS